MLDTICLITVPQKCFMKLHFHTLCKPFTTLDSFAVSVDCSKLILCTSFKVLFLLASTAMPIYQGLPKTELQQLDACVSAYSAKPTTKAIDSSKDGFTTQDLQYLAESL